MSAGSATTVSWTLFLDFDGVLNNEPFLRHQRNHVPAESHRLFDPKNVEALNSLCHSLPVGRIVVTSSWRLERSLGDLQGLLVDEGFRHAELLTHVTSNIAGDVQGRADEIMAFVDAANDDRWLVVDDMKLASFFSERFFQTSMAHGLTDALCAEIVKALDGKASA